MSAGEPRDVLRSVQRWAALLLGGDVSPSGSAYTVLLAEENRVMPVRPYAVVSSLAAFAPTGPYRVTVPQGDVEMTGSVSLSVFPDAPGDVDGPPVPPRNAWSWAQLVMGRLRAGVDRGVVLEATDVLPERRFSRPMDVPLFDYAGVPDVGPDRAGPDLPYGFMDVIGSNMEVLPDPESDVLFSVVADLRLSVWVAGAALTAAEAGPVVAAMPGTFVPPSP